ncbi:MAG TPA: pyruvate formate lyase family protein [Clostridiaceae bacterium]
MLDNNLNYSECLKVLTSKKLKQTAEKVKKLGYMDEDDYGTVPTPENFSWEPTPNHPNGSFYGNDGWAKNFSELMKVCPVYIDPQDALAGRWSMFLSRSRKVKCRPEDDFSFLKEDQEKYNIDSGIGADSHFAPDYKIGLELGWKGLLEKVRYYSNINENSNQGFYKAEEDTIIAVQTWIKRTIDEIYRLEIIESRMDFKTNLENMAIANEWVIDNPPRTLREACQWIAWFNMVSRTFNRDGAGGQLDELLRPYYEKDLSEGLINDEDAIFYIACLLLNDSHYYQLGGPDITGKDLTSPISFLILEAAHKINCPNNLTIRVHDGLNREFYLKSVKYLFEDKMGWPRYCGDKGLNEGFMKNGYSIELARQRIAVGCNWMSLPGREYTMNDCVKINTAKVFEVAFSEMLEDKSKEYSVERLWEYFEKHLRKAVLCTARGIDFQLAHQKDNSPELLMNLLCHGPIEKGRDVTDCGVEYYNMCIDGVALATVADSFAALEQRIEAEKVLTWEEIIESLKNNYASPKDARIRLMMKSSDKYGQGNSLGDKCADRVSKLFTDIVKEKTTPNGYNLIPGWFSWSRTITYGKNVGATPNGRYAGDPVSHGANPEPGFQKESAPTAMARAIARIQPGYGNTAPIQLELDPGLGLEEDGIEKIASLIETHFKLGGTLFNINVINADQILKAHKDPWKYPELVVRVTGFTAYFAALSPEFRQLVVDRIIRG